MNTQSSRTSSKTRPHTPPVRGLLVKRVQTPARQRDEHRQQHHKMRQITGGQLMDFTTILKDDIEIVSMTRQQPYTWKSVANLMRIQ